MFAFNDLASRTGSGRAGPAAAPTGPARSTTAQQETPSRLPIVAMLSLGGAGGNELTVL